MTQVSNPYNRKIVTAKETPKETYSVILAMTRGHPYIVQITYLQTVRASYTSVFAL